MLTSPLAPLQSRFHRAWPDIARSCHLANRFGQGLAFFARQELGTGGVQDVESLLRRPPGCSHNAFVQPTAPKWRERWTTASSDGLRSRATLTTGSYRSDAASRASLLMAQAATGAVATRPRSTKRTFYEGLLCARSQRVRGQ